MMKDKERGGIHFSDTPMVDQRKISILYMCTMDEAPNLLRTLYSILSTASRFFETQKVFLTDSSRTF
ncbi:hypothetical protein HBI24_069480 [Parastagonospora nodorum]|nr:hypothetical protein HBH53_005090 [Parastagonospora nodorum]KAH3976755.1 hypothetical protein HBH51_076430 [Parastagonospora nodorum]KAH4007732.1 hypothetical protein HBI10_004300 [Parastagonospora nodorum]KAH4023296.1 hypothetical protein HBI13_086010 [Parastagonospora nodorum]KAH4069113.1 hypothetical protein HBH50_108980 [Parastagonospora nodorum]